MEFTEANEFKIIEIWQHPQVLYCDVKLLNRSKNQMKMGLGYLCFKGKCDQLKLKDTRENPVIISHSLENRSMASERQPLAIGSLVSERQSIREQPIEINLDSESAMIPEEPIAKPTDIYCEEEGQSQQKFQQLPILPIEMQPLQATQI